MSNTSMSYYTTSNKYIEVQTVLAGGGVSGIARLKTAGSKTANQISLKKSDSINSADLRV